MLDEVDEQGRARLRGYPDRDMSGRVDIPEGWKEPRLVREENKPSPLLEESSFSTLFPAYREPYLTSIWPRFSAFLRDEHGISAELDLRRGSITIRTTKETWDPTSILCARHAVWMLARSMPLDLALRCFDYETECDIIRIKNLASTKEMFVKRRGRLVGPNGQTVRAIELLTGTRLVVQGTTVSVIGPSQGVTTVRNIVTDCMERNIHPVQHIKTLMIKRELAKVPELQNEDWSRFLPVMKKTHKKTHKSLKKRAEGKAGGEYTHPESKLDRQIASGEFFAKKEGDPSPTKSTSGTRKKGASVRTREDSSSEIPSDNV
ncbi:Ribosomal RNA assembly protein KRR1 [Giardia muris]|uniref:KRR-R motif-containing protein 1 n=1 Tax=Giardia muris TaxID=5742 RepID=A0A4Z1SSY6_GIAMU|nr:Ribosomal RNA assembly protein KRR1 [Giardia muris]|eukprot:TNJ28994.1 Ribosomal RNA assembly protein KRR1 [Giardia muris]